MLSICCPPSTQHTDKQPEHSWDETLQANIVLLPTEMSFLSRQPLWQGSVAALCQGSLPCIISSPTWHGLFISTSRSHFCVATIPHQELNRPSQALVGMGTRSLGPSVTMEIGVHHPDQVALQHGYQAYKGEGKAKQKIWFVAHSVSHIPSDCFVLQSWLPMALFYEELPEKSCGYFKTHSKHNTGQTS